jgi:hypothetical protein
MPGLGLGLGLNRRQQNRFAQAAQTPGGGQQWLAAHPGVQGRINRVDPTSQQATNIGNFVGAGQMAPGAAPRFQPGTLAATQRPQPIGGPGQIQAPQGSGATGSAKRGGQPGPGMPPPPGATQDQWNSMFGPSQGPQPAANQTPQYWNQPGYQGPTGPNGEPPGTWGAMSGGNMAQPGYQPPPSMPSMTTTIQPLSAAQQAAMNAYQGSPAQQMAQQNARNPNFMANAWNRGLNPYAQSLANQGAGAANAAGMNSAQTGFQNQQQQNLMRMIMQAFGGGGGQGF